MIRNYERETLACPSELKQGIFSSVGLRLVLDWLRKGRRERGFTSPVLGCHFHFQIYANLIKHGVTSIPSVNAYINERKSFFFWSRHAKCNSEEGMVSSRRSNQTYTFLWSSTCDAPSCSDFWDGVVAFRLFPPYEYSKDRHKAYLTFEHCIVVHRRVKTDENLSNSSLCRWRWETAALVFLLYPVKQPFWFCCFGNDTKG